MKELRIKEWLERKIQDEAARYNMWLNVAYIKIEGTDIDIIDNHGGYITVYPEEIIRETEKAIYVRLATGHIDGSSKGWKCWLPKSAIEM